MSSSLPRFAYVSAGPKMQSEMTSRLDALCFDANDPLRLALFWAAALRWEVDDEDQDVIELVPTDGIRFGILFLAAPK